MFPDDEVLSLAFQAFVRVYSLYDFLSQSSSHLTLEDKVFISFFLCSYILKSLIPDFGDLQEITFKGSRMELQALTPEAFKNSELGRRVQWLEQKLKR